MPGSQERDRHDESNVIPFPGSLTADSFPSQVDRYKTSLSLIDEAVITRLRAVNEQARDAKTCFEQDNFGRIFPKVLTTHLEHGIPAFIPADDYFGEHGISPEEQQLFFDGRGAWTYRVRDLVGVYETPASLVNRFIRRALWPINNVEDRVLDSLTRTGYNIHGLEHPDKVVQIGNRLLDMRPADTPAEQESRKRNVAIIGQSHDIGNIFNRDGHGHVSANMLEYIVPEVKEDPESWRSIRRAIILHDSDNLQAVVDSWGLEGEEKLEKLADVMQPDGLAAITADKAHIGIERVSDAILAGEIAEDVHAAVNAMGKYSSFNLDGDALALQITFDPEVTDQVGRFRHFISGWKRRLESGEVNISFPEWEKMFAGIYTDRMITVGMCSLAMYPFIEKFKLEMTDPSGNLLKEGAAIGRKTLEHDISTLKNRKQELVKAGVSQYRR